MNEIMISSLVFSLTYGVLLLDKLPKVAVVTLGAAVMLLIHHHHAAHLLHHIDIPVLLLLAGMMMMVHLTGQQGVFNHLTAALLNIAKGRIWLLFVLMMVVIAFLSAWLDNVTTVLLMVPLIFSSCRSLGISPLPFLMGSILFSNIGGTATLVGDPPNLLIASAAKLGFNDFIRELTPIVVVVFTAVMALVLVWYRRALFVKPIDEATLTVPTPSPIRWKGWVCLAVLMLSFLGFLTHPLHHIEPYIIATVGAGILLLLEGNTEAIHAIEWQTIVFFVGLFVLVGGVVEAGMVRWLAEHLLALTQGDPTTTTLGLLWGSGILSGIVDNIPYTATMIPLVQGLVEHGLPSHALWWALSLGACLGGNTTLVGAAANIIVAELAEKEGLPISFSQFLLLGLSSTAIALALSSVYLVWRYL